MNEQAHQKAPAGASIVFHIDTPIIYRMLFVFFFLSASVTLSVPSLASDTSQQTQPLLDNLRFTIDASTRSTRFSIQDQSSSMHALGFDIHKVFTSDHRNIGTLILQGYITRIDDHPAPPGIFDDGDDTELIYRIFNFNYTGFTGNAPNIRIGHYEVAYGLEHAIGTNGTLRQYQHVKNLGIKADWGVSLNKQHKRFEYEIGATTGGNQNLNSNNGSYVFATRIGTPRDENTVYGISIYKSKLGATQRKRLGLDTRYYYGRHGIFAEISLGNNNNLDVRNGLLEWNITNNRNSWLYYTQLSYLSNDTAVGATDEALQGVLGIQYIPDPHWDVSAQYSRDMSVFGTAQHQTLFSAQLRYRY